ncbi:acyl-CoA dehydrogenase family protein [Bacillus atrophaeus]
MIDFSLTEEQKHIQHMAKSFAKEHIRPYASQYDEEETFPRDILEMAHKRGLTHLMYPKEFGGHGDNDPYTPLILAEELAWGCAGINTVITSSYLPAEAIFALGTRKQQERFIPLFCDKENLRIGAMALTEPEAGSNVSSLKTRAVQVGDRYVINGTKKFIGNGGIADLHVVFAKVRDEDGQDTIAPFVITNQEKKGLSILRKDKKMGIRATHTAEITLENVEVPLENRLSKGKRSKEEYKGMLLMLNRTRPLVAAAAVGVAKAAFEYAAEYAQNRMQFNKPIIEHQGVAFLLADMSVKIDAARLLTWQACAAGIHKTDNGFEASKAKLFSAETAREVTANAVQIVGGNGYLRDHPVEKWMRDAKIFEIWEGTSEIQRLNISRYIQKFSFGKDGAPCLSKN